MDRMARTIYPAWDSINQNVISVRLFPGRTGRRDEFTDCGFFCERIDPIVKLS